jgi:hypothetical protein
MTKALFASGAVASPPLQSKAEAKEWTLGKTIQNTPDLF